MTPLTPIYAVGMMRFSIFVLPFCALALFFTSCTSQPPLKCDVLVSIPPYIYFVNQLTSSELTVCSLAPEGSNPHLYEPTPGQVTEAHLAKVWIRLSEGFEKKIYKSLQESKNAPLIVNLAEATDIPHLQEESLPCCSHSHQGCSHNHHESRDLHIWLSLRLAKQQAQVIAQTLSSAFPERKEQIATNLIQLLDSFEKADREITELLLPYKGESILVSHAAFGYFCHDYGLEQIAIECEGKDPLPQNISSLLESAKHSQIRTVLIQSQYNNKGALMIAEQLKLPVHEIDPYSKDYLQNIKHLASMIAE